MDRGEEDLPMQPTIMPLGDTGILVRFSDRLDDMANRQALALAAWLEAEPISGILEVVPSLVSVLVRYDPLKIGPVRLAGEISLRIGKADQDGRGGEHLVRVRFDGPDLDEVVRALGLERAAFVEAHNQFPLRVLTTGFAPGFVYCGFHPETLVLPRRREVRPVVKAGSVLFAAGQTAIAATDIPTGWHVIGETDFRNFDPARERPTLMTAGDTIRFEAIA